MMRSDFAAIAEWVAPGSQVLDVGCGDGSLLHHLKVAKQAHVYGVELADDKVLACTQKGLNVVQQDLEDGLALFEDQSFDKVILSQTLQTIHQTARILSEIARVGKECVVSFPNFGHWSHRSAVLLGRMPVSKSLPYQWYDTPNVRV
jgi:methionine biosynthesis protein MetW